MICPMSFDRAHDNDDPIMHTCLESGCAWWIVERYGDACCAMMSLAKSQDAISAVAWQHGITTGLVG